MTTVDVRAPQYASGVATGVTLSAAGGDAVLTSTLASNNSIGVNNPSINDTAFQSAFGPGGEGSNFNGSEAWVFEFDTAVTIDQFNFSSIDDGDQFTRHGRGRRYAVRLRQHRDER